MAETKLRLKLPEFNKGEEGSKARLYILLGVLVVLSVVAIIVNLSLGSYKPPEVANNQPELDLEDLAKDIVQVLPQLERDDSSPEDEIINTSSLEGIDPFALPMELLGVISGGGGNDLAIIKARQTTYIASLGQKVAGAWEVLEINRNSVRLKGDTKEIVVELGSWD